MDADTNHSIGLIQSNRYTIPSIYVVLLWEALVNFDEEHDLIHQARWGSVKVCYLMCRYYPVAIFPVYIWVWVTDHDMSLCSKSLVPLQILLVPLTLCPQSVLIIRAFAFTNRNSYVLLLLSVCFLALLGAQIWAFAKQDGVSHTIFATLGACGSYTKGIYIRKHIGYVMLTATAADAVALAVVLIHCIRIRSTQGSLGRLFLQQGISGFLIMLLLNITSALVYLNPNHQLGFGAIYALVFPNIIACRFILELRRRVSPTETYVLRFHSELVRDAVGELEPPGRNSNSLHEDVQYFSDASVLSTPPISPSTHLLPCYLSPRY